MEERDLKDPSTQDVLDAINTFAENVEERFNVIDNRFNAIDGQFKDFGSRFDCIDSRFDRLETEIGKIKATMVTKDYLDTKMFQLRGDLVVYDKTADAKTDALVDALHAKKVLDNKTASNIKNSGPFKRKSIAA